MCFLVFCGCVCWADSGVCVASSSWGIAAKGAGDAGRGRAAAGSPRRAGRAARTTARTTAQPPAPGSTNCRRSAALYCLSSKLWLPSSLSTPLLHCCNNKKPLEVSY